jgi:hypothetical protein
MSRVQVQRKDDACSKGAHACPGFACGPAGRIRAHRAQTRRALREMVWWGDLRLVIAWARPRHLGTRRGGFADV